MPARTHVVKVVLFVLCVSLGVLQSGCGSSAGGGKAEAPAGSGSDIHLALSTASGFTAVVADGRSTVPIRIQVTNAAGAGVAGVPVTFATTAGSLSESPIVRASRAISSDEQTAIPRADGAGSVTVNTDANGIAQVILTASTQAQTVVVTADVQGFRTNIVIEFAPGPAARVQLNTSAATVNAAGTATLTATVTDANGNPVPGETVTFTFTTNTSGATLSATSAVTNTNGQATVKYTAGVVPGADTVQAKATSTSVTGSTSLTVPDITSSAAVKSIAVIAGATSVVADGATPVAIRATVAVASGVPAGILVTFTTTAGSLSPATARTDANGVATVNLIAGTSLGKATVTAAAGGFNTTTTVDFVAGAPATLRLTATPTTVNTRANATITASVTDANGNPVTGQTLTFSLQTNTSGATLSTLNGPTDASGQFTLTYRAGGTPGTDIVQARTANGIVGTVTVTVSAAVSNVTGIAVVAGATNVVADGTTPVAIRATVTVASGSPAGITVSFITTAGRMSPATATTDATGVATVNLIAGTSLGTATVTAAAGGFSTTTTVTFVAGAPAVLRLSAAPTTVNTRANATITANVTDANGNPVNGQTLTFSLPVNASGAELSTLSGSTNASGQFTLTYKAGATPGTDTVQARTANGIVGTVTMTVSVGVSNVTAIAVVAEPDEIVADGKSPVAIHATVTVASGSPAGITVSFTTTAGSLPKTTADTDASGVATVNLIAATSLGTATVTAAAGGFSANVTVKFVAGPPAFVTLSATPATVNVAATSKIQAAVTDATGNPTAEQTLVFSFTPPSAIGSTLNPLIGVTDQDGRVTVTYTAGTTPGTDTVQARTVNNITGTVSITVTPLGSASTIDLLVSSPNLPSSGAGNVTLTALVRDQINNAVSGVLVTFSADSGNIQVVEGTTGPSGAATALLTTGGNPRNRTITVRATTSALGGPCNIVPLPSNCNTVQVTGTTLTISGANTLVLGATTQLTILLRDSGGAGISNQAITVSSARGNTLSATTVTTDTTGQATVTVTAIVAGDDTITVASLGATAAAALSVSADNFVFTTPAPPPAPTTQVPLNTPQSITVHWDQGGTPRGGELINFFATRGNFAATAVCPVGVVSTITATTDGGGNATVNICSDNAGPAVISAAANVSPGPSSEINIEFIATTVASLVLQATRTTLGVNPPGTTTQQSVITAVARDAQGNLVKNQTVSFSLQDVSGGRISPASAVTDSFGRASTVYTAGAAPSANNGVIITATTATVPCIVLPAPAPPPLCLVTLTVAQQPLFVILGTGNVVNTPSSTQYALPYSALVTDANGNPVNGATVEFTVLPTRYQKGFYVQVFDSNGACVGWGKAVTAPACQNEDTNSNGLLDAGEDFNSNGRLDPGNVATVPTSGTTNASGFVFFDVVYARQFTWVEVALRARTVVGGSEGSSTEQFFLPGAASDFNNCTVAPPGATSPYGIATTCACDERTDALCPIVSVSGPVIITSLSGTTLPTNGGTFTFGVTGGTQTAYTLATTAGTLSTTTVVFGATFTLTTTAAQNGATIILSARDTVTGQTGTITLTQL